MEGSRLYYTMDDALVGADVFACGGARFSMEAFMTTFRHGLLLTIISEVCDERVIPPVNRCTVFAIEQRELVKLKPLHLQ
jgi:hypothetical protein